MAKGTKPDVDDIEDEPEDKPIDDVKATAPETEVPEDDGDEDGSVAAPPEAEPVPEYESLRDVLKLRGYVAEEDDDESVVDGLLRKLQAAETERQRYAQQQQAQQQYAQQLQVWQAQQQYAAQQAQQAQQKRELQGRLAAWNKVPEYDQQWMEFLTTDDQGNVVVKPGGDPTLPQKIAARREWERQAVQSMISEPVGFVQDAFFQNPQIQQHIQSIATQVAHQLVQQSRQQDMEAAQIADEVRGWAFDEQRKPTAAGQVYLQAVQQFAIDPRTPTPKAQHDAAMQYVLPLLKQMQAQQPASTPKESGAAKRIGILKKGATNLTGRGGSLPKTERKVPAQDGRLSLDERLRRSLAAEGVLDMST